VVRPAAPDQQLFSENTFPGEAELLGDPLRSSVADRYPQGQPVKTQLLESNSNQSGGRFGGYSFGRFITSHPIADLTSSGHS
jgi:hypothetical protein